MSPDLILCYLALFVLIFFPTLLLGQISIRFTVNDINTIMMFS